MEALQRAEYDARSLMAEHPPELHDRNKQLVFDIAMPAGSEASGIIDYVRWPAMSLPAAVDFQAREPAIDARGGYFDYAPVLEPGEGVEWHLNFADAELFGYYGGPLFAQDEMQVAEHPVLASLREALRSARWPARTVEARNPTPVLVMGAERRCTVATDPNRAEGRPHGLYGNAFGRADREAITRATTRLDPPTISNILAIAAPSPGFGTYSRDEIESILVTAYSGFRTAVIESSRTAGDGSKIAIHTGYWGCGAFGGNRTLMAGLQVLAARMAGLNRLVFHTGAAGGEAPLEQALALVSELGNEPMPTNEVISTLAARNFEWGVSDGN